MTDTNQAPQGEAGAQSNESIASTGVVVPADLQPLIPDLNAAVEEAENGTAEPIEQTAAEVREAIEAAALEAQEVAQASAKVDLQFPAIGFIDPVKELENMRRLVATMPEDARKRYPDEIRSKLLAHHADNTKPGVTDEELALAIFIKRTTDSALTPEELETKATGKSSKPKKEPKPGKEPKKGIDDILGGL